MSWDDKVTEPNRNKNSNIWPPHLGIQTEVENYEVVISGCPSSVADQAEELKGQTCCELILL